MPINSRESRREAERKKSLYTNDYIARFFSLFHNSIKLKGIDGTPKRYFLQVLLEHGAIAYDKITGLWLRFNPIGIDIYGLPTRYNLIGYNGFIVTRNAEDVVIIRANDLSYGWLGYFKDQSEKLVNFDTAINQNLEAIRTMTIAEVDGQENLLSLVNLAETRRVGGTVVYANKHAMAGAKLTVQSTGAEFLCDKLQQARLNVFNETLATIGIASANTTKRERVQTIEVNASMGYGKDCLSTMIDTINYDAEFGGLPLRAERNTSIDDNTENKVKDGVTYE